jgi:hypothetical protein
VAQVEGADPAADNLPGGIIGFFEDGDLEFRIHGKFPPTANFGFCSLKIARNGGNNNRARRELAAIVQTTNNTEKESSALRFNLGDARNPLTLS